MDGQKSWNIILSQLKTEVSPSIFKTWFSGSWGLEFKTSKEKDILVVAVKNNFLKEHLESRFIDKILSTGRNKVSKNLEVLIVVSGEQARAKLRENEPIFSGVPQSVLTLRKPDSLNQNYTFNNFVVGASNNLAYHAAKQISSNVGTYNPLLFFGQTGVGKTHIMQAVGHEFLEKVDMSKVLYVSAEKFTNDYLESLSNKTQAAFRSKYRKVDLLLVDDVQFLAGKESTQDEFFYTFNELFLSGRQVVLASDRHPKELGRFKERLLSRFLGGMICDIGIPDLEMKVAILKTRCACRQINLDGETLNFIAQSCQGGARELEGALSSVLSIINFSGEKIDFDAVRRVLSANQTVRPKVTAEQIVNAVCQHFNLQRKDLAGASRKSSIVFARQTLMFLLRKNLEMPLCEIGDIVGGRDHSTVIHGIEKISLFCTKNQQGRDEILRLQSLFNKE